MNKAIFLDKDGTLVDNSQYPEIIPTDTLLEHDILEGLLYLQQRNFKLIIVSNQSFITKGRLTEQQVHEIFKSVIMQLKKKGIDITAYYFCPHRSEDHCPCHKPATALVQKAAQAYHLDLPSCYFVGDMEEDILTGKNAGMKTVLVRTGKGGSYSLSNGIPDYTIPNLNHIREVLQ